MHTMPEVRNGEDPSYVFLDNYIKFQKSRTDSIEITRVANKGQKQLSKLYNKLNPTHILSGSCGLLEDRGMDNITILFFVNM